MSAKFGPAGNSESFSKMGYKSSLDVPEYVEKTFAARPVGANNTTRRCNCTSIRTSAEINVVFPVPAYPQSIKTALSSDENIKSDNFSKEISCSAVGLNGKFALICAAKYLFITFIK